MFFYLLYADQCHWLWRYRLLDRQRRHRLDENHASLLQSQRAGQGVCMLWSLRGSESTNWTGP